VLLSAVDVVRGSCDSGVTHQVYGETADVSRFDDSPHRQRLTELLTSLLEIVAYE
jgi:hypothetical protein